MPAWNPVANEIFAQALDLTSPEERAAFLTRACGEDAQLYVEVEALLAAHDRAGAFLEGPADDSQITGLFAPQRPGHSVLSAPEMPGSRLGRYKLLQRLGEGGMGVVWLAEQTEPVRRQVALKLIRVGMDSRAVQARFEAERQALALMDHPNIAKVLDGGTTGTGRPYFVMELVKGTPIVKYCDEHRLTTRARLELFIPVCLAVQHAHQKGILHRDLKPSNVLIAPYDGHPVPKVIDFGVAKAIGPRLTEKTLFTEVGAVIGTLEYMSPEQAELNNQDIDTRSDIYALGVLLYELLTGSTPLDRQRLQQVAFNEILRLIREEEPPKPSTRLSSSERLPSLSAQRQVEPRQLGKLMRGELDWIVMKALEKDRNRRYESASSFAQDLQRHLISEPVSAGPPGAMYRLRKLVWRHRGLVTAAALLLFVLVSGVIGTTWGFLTARQERDNATSAQHQADRLRAEAEMLRDRALAGEHIAKERLALVMQQKTQLERAELRAAQERDVAKAIALFLQKDLLGQAAPEEQATAEVRPQREIQVRTLLDRAAAKIEGRFAQQPSVEAALRRTLGTTYEQLGDYQAAEAHLLRLHQLVEKAPDAYARYDALHALGRLYAVQGRLKEAAPLLARAWEAARVDLGTDHPDALLFGQDWAHTLLHLGQYPEAEKVMRDLHQRRLRVSGPLHHDTLSLENNLAVLLLQQNRYPEVEKLLRGYLDKLQRSLGTEHPSFLIASMNLGVTLVHLGRFAEGEKMLQETAATQARVQGPDHPDTLHTGACLAGAYLMVRRFQEAITIGQPLLERQLRVLGPLHHEVLNALNNLGVARQQLGRPKEAVADFTRCLEGRRKVLPLDHPNTVQTEINLAMAHYALNNIGEMEPLLNHALAVKRRSLPQHHPELLDLVHMQAFVCYRLQKWTAAEKLYVELQAPPAAANFSASNRARQRVWLGVVWCHLQRKVEGMALVEMGLNVLMTANSWPVEYRSAVQDGIAVLAQGLRAQKREKEALRWEERLRQKLEQLEKKEKGSVPAGPVQPR